MSATRTLGPRERDSGSYGCGPLTTWPVLEGEAIVGEIRAEYGSDRYKGGRWIVEGYEVRREDGRVVARFEVAELGDWRAAFRAAKVHALADRRCPDCARTDS